jgi:hypothetical protein
MTVFTALRSYLGEIERRRRFYRTQRIMSGMPPEMLKDIGWPGAAEGIDDACHPAPAWRN